MGYVCAFRGRRDSYQVPVALAEVESLDCFVTDHYFGPLERTLAGLLPARLSEKLRQRFDPGIPADRVRRLRLTAAAEAIARATGSPSIEIFERFDPRYGEAAALVARHRRSDLLIYSSYAWSAFNASYSHTPRKILFQFHPHYALEASILEADCLASAEAGITFAGGIEKVLDIASTAADGVATRPGDLPITSSALVASLAIAS